MSSGSQVFYRARAPLRLGLAGGGTDVSPYCDRYGGAVLNATISLYAHATIRPFSAREEVVLFHERTGAREVIPLTQLLKNYPENSDPFALQKGAIVYVAKEMGKDFPGGFELRTTLDVPSGSGLGTSSTLMVAILGALSEWLNIPLGEYELAHTAYIIERKRLGMVGGKQDQYAATFGGVNFMEFYAEDRVIVNPLRVRKEYLFELEHHLVLAYLRRTRRSGRIIEEQIQNVEREKARALESMHQTRHFAFRMKDALLRGEIRQIGELMHQAWQAKKQMASQISSPEIDALYEGARVHGALGGKISGAGGGGFMMFFVEEGKRENLKHFLEEQGCVIYNFRFEKEGLFTWTVPFRT